MQDNTNYFLLKRRKKYTFLEKWIENCRLASGVSVSVALFYIYLCWLDGMEVIILQILYQINTIM